MSASFIVNWSVVGQSTVNFTDDELSEVGLSEEKIEEIGGYEAFYLLDEHSRGDIRRGLVDSWDELEKPDVLQLDVVGSDGWLIA